MIVYVNKNDEIKDVGSTTDERLTKVEIADDEYNPFRDWPVAKILCYKVLVKDNRVVMMTPYVDSRLIEHIEKLGKDNDDLINYQCELLEQICELQLAVEMLNTEEEEV